MELRHLRYFLAVADQLHFTKAAAALRVAQPALSAQIRNLEEEIGAKLFDRTNRRVNLSPAGQVFRVRARAALEQAERAVVDARKAAQGEAGTLTVGFVSAALFSVLPRLLDRFRQSAPAARIELEEMDPGAQLEALRSGGIDFGLLHGEVRNRQLMSRLISREAVMAALPKDHPAARKTKVELRSLLKERIFLPRRHEFSRFHDQLVHACQNAGFAAEDLHSTRLLLTSLYLVAGRQGIALVPESFRRQRVAGVVFRPLRGALPAVELVGVWRQTDHAPLLIRLLRELEGIVAPNARRD